MNLLTYRVCSGHSVLVEEITHNLSSFSDHVEIIVHIKLNVPKVAEVLETLTLESFAGIASELNLPSADKATIESYNNVAFRCESAHLNRGDCCNSATSSSDKAILFISFNTSCLQLVRDTVGVLLASQVESLISLGLLDVVSNIHVAVAGAQSKVVTVGTEASASDLFSSF